ncbi:MAG: hypothetical protein B7Z66_05135 [Chromatiales bacterium 21-64-14]|nr:MAG: hypothetical protein B7Z66_05135 [Chromatiales bacterium 21-64-14]HQU16487.1 FHA domain-containing protein [Gammaproteobacteria bacterium]
MPKLVHSLEGTAIREYEIVSGTLRVGRGPENEIRIDDPTVSTRHALLTVRPSPYMESLCDVVVEDLGSTNGTQVNGKPATRHLLKHGDVLRVGAQELRFVSEDGLDTEGTRILLPDSDA